MLVILTLAVGRAGAAEAGEYVRLHVVADSDAPAAQALKLAVRDAVLSAARALLSDAADADDAWHIVLAHSRALEAAARERARALGYAGPVACETGVFAFPERAYGAARVPAGDYRALRVVIGSGRGRNWWCVLYPSLCWPADVDPARPRFYSALLKWLGGLFGGGAA